MPRFAELIRHTTLTALLIAPATSLAMTCDEVMDMVKLNIPANIVVDTMASSGHAFTADDAKCLTSKGAPPEVIAAASAAAATPAAEPPAPPQNGERAVRPPADPAPSTFEQETTLGGATFGDDTSGPDASGPEPSGGGPSVLEEAIEAYRAKKYLTSSNALHDLLKGGQYPDQQTKIQYYLAKSLYDLRMYHSAQYYFMQVVRKGPRNPYFKYALPRLVAIAQLTGNNYELLRIVAKIPPEAFPRQARNHLNYLMGRKLFDRSELSQSSEAFSLVSAKSDLYMRAKYYEGIIQQEQGKLKSSVMSFREVMKAKPPVLGDARSARDIEDMKDLALINVARIYFGIERFDNADNYYKLVEPDSTYWAESLFERAWTNFIRKDLNVTLGLLLTVESPYFTQDEFIPEVALLRALTFFSLCEFTEVERLLQKFETDYAGMQIEIDNFVNQYRESKELWDQAYDSYFTNRHDESETNSAMFVRILRNRDLSALVRHLDMMDDELLLVDAQKALWRDTVGDELKQIIERDRLQYKKRAGGELLKELLRQNESLKSLLVQAEILRFEVNDAQRADYEFKATLDDIDAGQKRAYDFSTSKDIIYWPFNGEFWRDELGYYEYTEHSTCQ